MLSIRGTPVDFGLSLVVVALAASPHSSTLATFASSSSATYNLQRMHKEKSPQETFEELANVCERLGLKNHNWDVYGDFDKDSSQTSFLRKFESEVAQELGTQDAVFMPSGGMAQSIALLIHATTIETSSGSRTNSSSSCGHHCFACHHTSHLLLHEQAAYYHLLGMNAIIVDTLHQAEGISIPPLTFAIVQQVLDDEYKKWSIQPSTLLLELPHREIGGKTTPWNDILQIRKYCTDNNIKLHLDGARLFEATTGYPDQSLQELVQIFDSVYISFYKGLGGMTGAMLLGSEDFCGQARIWLRRFGGNLYTLLPYAVSGWAGYQRQWKLNSVQEKEEKEVNGPLLLSFVQKKEKLVRLVQLLCKDEDISRVLEFDPTEPETNMIHGYLFASVEQCSKMLNKVEKEHDIRVLFRLRPVPEDTPAYELGYRAYFEWAIGEDNGAIPEEVFVRGWTHFAKELLGTSSSS